MSSIHQIRELIESTFSLPKNKNYSVCLTQSQTIRNNKSTDEYFGDQRKQSHTKRISSPTSDASSKKKLIELIIPSQQPRLFSSSQTRIKRDLISLKKIINPEAFSPVGFRNRPKVNTNQRNMNFDKKQFLAQSPTQKCVVLPRNSRNRINLFKQMVSSPGKKDFNFVTQADRRDHELFVRDLSKGKIATAYTQAYKHVLS